MTALRVGPPVDGVKVGVKDPCGDLVGVVIVVTVLRGPVEEELAGPLVPLEVLGHDVEEAVHGEVPLVEDVEPD